MFQFFQVFFLAACCLLNSGVQAHTYFATNLTAAGMPTPIATFKSYTHDGAWLWSLNSTSDAGITSLEIVDKKGSVSAPTYISAVELIPGLNTTDAASGMLMLNGSFVASDINAAVAESLEELSGHICMGHILLRANTTSGEPLLAPIEYQVNRDGETCEEATAVVEDGGSDTHASGHGAAVAASSSALSGSSMYACGVKMLIAVGAIALAV